MAKRRHHHSRKHHSSYEGMEHHEDHSGERLGAKRTTSREEHRAGEKAMYRKHHSMGAEHYAGMEPRRRQEMEDAGMIREDHSQIANLPQGVMMKPYPMSYDYMPENLDDTIRGVDGQIEFDDRKRDKHMYPKKV